MDGDVIEIKTMDFSTRENWGRPGTDEVPPEVYVQTVVQLEVTTRERKRLGLEPPKQNRVIRCDRGTMELEEYIIYPDPMNARLCREMSIDFWERHVKKLSPPPPTERDGENILYLFPEAAQLILISTPEVDDLALEMQELYRDFKPKEKRYEELKTLMSLCAANAAALDTICGRFELQRRAGRVSWQKVAVALKASKELIEQHTGSPYVQLKTPF